jgi:anti-anti-sigma factor
VLDNVKGRIMLQGQSSTNDRKAHTLPFWRQIRWNLTFAFVGLVVLALTIVQALTLPLIRANAQQQVHNQLESVAALKHNQINRWLYEGQYALTQLLSSPVENQLRTFVAAPAADTVEQGRINTLLQETATVQGAHTGSGSLFRALFLYAPNGRIVAASNERQIGQVVTQQPYFAKSLTTDQIQAPYYALGSSELTVVVTRRLLDSSERTIGILGGSLDLTVLATIMLERSGLGESGETYLVSLESQYLLTPSRFPGYQSTKAYNSEGIHRALRGENGSGTYLNYRTPPMQIFGVYRWVPELQAALLTEIETTEALTAADQVWWRGIILTLITTVVAILVAIYSAARVSWPIIALTRVAVQITEGAVDVRADTRQQNEIGVLAAGFNTMTDTLQQTLAGLEQRVAERTETLQQALCEREQTLLELKEALHTRDLLSRTVRELSSPVLPVHDDVLVMPLIGVIDSERAALLTQSLLQAIEQHQARIVLIDVTGVPLVDTHVAAVLLQAAAATKLLGVQAMLVGIRPEVAQAIVGLGVDLSILITHADLQSGISYALERRHSWAAGMRGRN